MRVLISADMEGATGVTSSEECRPGTAAWERCRHLLVGDVNAAIDGAFGGGAHEIVVVDAHNSMRNIPIEALDARADLISGNDKTYAMMEGIDEGIDLVFFVGYHAAAGQVGVLSHTWMATAIGEVTLNGAIASEGLINAALAGAHGVPVGLVTGDDVACADARSYTDADASVAVKRALSRYSARCLPPQRTANAICEAALASIKRYPTLHSFSPAGPYEWAVTFAATSSASRAATYPGVRSTGTRSVTWSNTDYPESYRTFQAVALLGATAVDPLFG